VIESDLNLLVENLYTRFKRKVTIWVRKSSSSRVTGKLRVVLILKAAVNHVALKYSTQGATKT
jgi:hypothetical protein